MRGHPPILSTLEHIQKLNAPVAFIRLACAHLVKQVKLIYAWLRWSGTDRTQRALCKKAGILLA